MLLRIALAAAVFFTCGANLACAYVGTSFVSIPGVAGDSKDPGHKDWIAFSAHYWKDQPVGPGGLNHAGYLDATFQGPSAPEHGAGTLNIALDKNSPVMTQLMAYCSGKQKIGELLFEESSERARTSGELGSRPGNVPEYYEYKLKDVVLSDCPVVADAPWQAFVVDFADIEWVNYKGHGETLVLPAGTASSVAPSSAAHSDGSAHGPDGATKTYVVTWIAAANYVGPNQCPTVNSRPSVDTYYTYMTKEAAAREQAALSSKGGPSFTDHDQMAYRGPSKLNVCALPGIVPDPGNVSPRSDVAHGFDLDGGDGNGTGASCPHKKYMSEDGQSRVDNQLFTVEGCMPGLQGSKGFIMQFGNKQLRDGLLSILIEVSGMQDEKNDDNVDVSIYYSLDAMGKNAAGDQILPDYSFRATDKPELAYFNTHLHGRVVNGVITTEPVDLLAVFLTKYGTPPALKLKGGRLRLEIMPDGKLKGALGGYQDWQDIANRTAAAGESYLGYQCPAFSAALKRAADGYRDPNTGACTAISAAYDIEAVPAFLVHGGTKTAAVQGADMGQSQTSPGNSSP